MKVIEANSKVMYKSLDELIDGVGVDKVKKGLVKHIKGYDFEVAKIDGDQIVLDNSDGWMVVIDNNFSVTAKGDLKGLKDMNLVKINNLLSVIENVRDCYVCCTVLAKGYQEGETSFKVKN